MIYQACLPEGLTLDPAARDMEWRVIPSAEYNLSRVDIVGNVLPYWLFGHLAFVAWWRRRPRLSSAALVGATAAALMAGAVEFVQLFNLIRGSAAWDLIAGVIGGILAVISGALYVTLVAYRLERWLRSETRSNPLVVAAAGLAAFILFDAALPLYLISSA